jgi:hypothetical protein
MGPSSPPSSETAGAGSRPNWLPWASPSSTARPPQTQGKIERFHQTLKRWLRKQDPVASIAELQGQVDFFVH